MPLMVKVIVSLATAAMKLKSTVWVAVDQLVSGKETLDVRVRFVPTDE